MLTNAFHPYNVLIGQAGRSEFAKGFVTGSKKAAAGLPSAINLWFPFSGSTVRWPVLPRIRLSDTTTPGMQWVGREEFLERERALWDECGLACDGRSSALTFNLSDEQKAKQPI